MSVETFTQNVDDITAIIRLLMAAPKSRELYRRAAVRVHASDELLAEVFPTAHGWVLVYRAALVEPSHFIPANPEATDARVPLPPHDNLRVQSAWFTNHHHRGPRGWVVAPLTGDGGQQFQLLSRQTAYLVLGIDLQRFLISGKGEFGTGAYGLTFSRYQTRQST